MVRARRSGSLIVVVQHGEKSPGWDNPGLTAIGRRQAFAGVRALATANVVAIYSSPLRRAVETASPIAEALGVRLTLDDALRERMDWSPDTGLRPDEFLAEWKRATADRDYQPKSGDSSHDAGKRFRAALLRYVSLHRDGAVVCVSHGGVTVDLLRDLLGDDELCRRAPTLMNDGMPGGALTTISRTADGWSVGDLAALSHITEGDRTGHRP